MLRKPFRVKLRKKDSELYNRAQSEKCKYYVTIIPLGLSFGQTLISFTKGCFATGLVKRQAIRKAHVS